jgi:hypothetical protein
MESPRTNQTNWGRILLWVLVALLVLFVLVYLASQTLTAEGGV